MRKDFTQLNKYFISASIDNGFLCCVMHYATINEKRRQAFIHCQNDCYREIIRKSRYLYFFQRISRVSNFKYPLNILPAASGTHIGE